MTEYYFVPDIHGGERSGRDWMVFCPNCEIMFEHPECYNYGYSENEEEVEE